MNNETTTANSQEQITDWLVKNYRATKNRPLHNTPPNSLRRGNASYEKEIAFFGGIKGDGGDGGDCFS
jgi:hypothetical protein